MSAQPPRLTPAEVRYCRCDWIAGGRYRYGERLPLAILYLACFNIPCYPCSRFILEETEDGMWSRAIAASASAVLLFLIVAYVTGAEVVVLIPSENPLDKGAKVGLIESPTLGAADAKISWGGKVQDALKGEGYVIELPTPKITPSVGEEEFILEKESTSRRFTIKKVEVAQPYKVWYIKNAGASPTLLGEGFAIESSSEAERLENGRMRIHQKSHQQLTQEALGAEPSVVAKTLRNALAGKVIVGPSVRHTLSDYMTASGLKARNSVHQRGDLPLFKPAKLTTAADGSITVEVAMHNRLPTRVTGTLEVRAPTGRVLTNLADPVEFDLKVGEKSVARLSVPARKMMVKNVVRPAPELGIYASKLTLEP